MLGGCNRPRIKFYCPAYRTGFLVFCVRLTSECGGTGGFMTALEELTAIMESHPEAIDLIFELLLQTKGPQALGLSFGEEAV